MDEKTRRRFDAVLEAVLEEMPPIVHELIEKVPLHVEDYPSPQIMREMGIERRDELCGLFSGVSIDEKYAENLPTLPDVVTIYREGIMASAADLDERGVITKKNLREEIRITILHELAHYHGISEEELEDLGYG